MYQHLRRRFKCGQGIGKHFVTSNGILQGCPISVILLNCLIAVWSSAVAEEVPQSHPEAYADDTGVTVSTRRAVQLAADTT
eukprot:10731311-Karenia_brevis.AAC.1